MAKSAAYRKYQLTINNPAEHGFTHDRIKTTLASFKGIKYWCLCDEIGAEGTYHTHIYFFAPNAIEFSTVQQRFYGAHIESAKGSHQDNRDYIRKEGKWLHDEKHETNLADTFEESGEMPAERNKRESESEEIFAMIQSGASNAEILREHPAAMNRVTHIDAVRQILLEEQYKEEFRILDVTYIWGSTGVGKTRSVMEQYGYRNVYRVTNYTHPFDNYKGEDVILFDEFRSSLPIADMLKYLDGYPTFLPCRYTDRVACYTKVYIISNIPLEKQYPNIQFEEPKTYEAFLRRIHHTYEMLGDAVDEDMPF